MALGGHQGLVKAFMAKNNRDFGGHQGGEKSRSRNLVLQPKLRLYEPLGGRNTCRTWFFSPRELNLRCLAPGSSLADPISPVWGLALESYSRMVVIR